MIMQAFIKGRWIIRKISGLKRRKRSIEPIPLASFWMQRSRHFIGGSGMVRSMSVTRGTVAAFRRVLMVERLPKTRSGKIVRSTMQKMADGLSWTMPATINDPAILEEIRQALLEKGLIQPLIQPVEVACTRPLGVTCGKGRP
jgi:hypothetical protein